MNQIKNIKYDLEERTAKFAEDIIELCKKVPKNVVTIPIISQLVRTERRMQKAMARSSRAYVNLL